MNEIIKPGFYLVTRLGDHFITEEQKFNVLKAIDAKAVYIELGDTIIFTTEFRQIVPSAQYAKAKDGGHYCSKHPKNFVPYGKKCGYC